MHLCATTCGTPCRHDLVIVTCHPSRDSETRCPSPAGETGARAPVSPRWPSSASRLLRTTRRVQRLRTYSFAALRLRQHRVGPTSGHIGSSASERRDRCGSGRDEGQGARTIVLRGPCDGSALSVTSAQAPAQSAEASQVARCLTLAHANEPTRECAGPLGPRSKAAGRGGRELRDALDMRPATNPRMHPNRLLPGWVSIPVARRYVKARQRVLRRQGTRRESGSTEGGHANVFRVRLCVKPRRRNGFQSVSAVGTHVGQLCRSLRGRSRRRVRGRA